MKVGIRKYRVGDAETLREAILESVEHVSKWMDWCTPNYGVKEAEEWVKSAVAQWESGSDYRFVIEDAETMKLLGCVGINQVVKQHMVGNLGYWIRKSALNKGVCTEAAKQAITYAFRELEFQRIEIHVLPENQESNAVAAKLGGLFEGTFRNKMLHRGVSKPANCYSVVPSDYGI